MNANIPALSIRAAQASDTPAIFDMIHALAVFEKLEHLMVAREELLHEALFGAKPACEALVGTVDGVAVTFALFFHNFSTFLCKKGLYLEDLYVRPEQRGNGYGKQMLVHLAQLALARHCARLEWSVLDWNDNAINFYTSMGADVMPDWRICRVTGPALTHLSARAGPSTD